MGGLNGNAFSAGATVMAWESVAAITKIVLAVVFLLGDNGSLLKVGAVLRVFGLFCFVGNRYGQKYIQQTNEEKGVIHKA